MDLEVDREPLCDGYRNSPQIGDPRPGAQTTRAPAASRLARTAATPYEWSGAVAA
jgi:hypothetical protein